MLYCRVLVIGGSGELAVAGRLWASTEGYTRVRRESDGKGAWRVFGRGWRFSVSAWHAPVHTGSPVAFDAGLFC